jgi:hypothetical protein
MKATYSALMASRFFNPAFNSAIFDGPVRIYFAQFHESMALKIYFSLQQKYPAEIAQAKETYKNLGQNVLVMIYPTTESFAMSFDDTKDFIQIDELSGDVVVGLNGPFEDELLPQVLRSIVDALNAADKISQVGSSSEVTENTHSNSGV